MAVVNTNIMSLTAQRNLSTNSASLATTMNRLSSGMRVNSSKDDAAGLAIAEKMTTQVRGMNMAARNANDGISFAQVAEGALSGIGANLQRMRELAVQSANGTNGDEERSALNKEYAQLGEEIKRVLDNTKFNGKNTFGTAASQSTATGITYQIGANNNSTNDQITVKAGATLRATGSDLQKAVTIVAAAPADTTASTAAVAGSGDISSQSTAQAAIDALDSAIKQVSGDRAEFGAIQNRFESVVSGLQQASENQAASRSRIMDTDYAMETASLSRSQVLQQASQAMLAQANQAPQSVLQLLR